MNLTTFDSDSNVSGPEEHVLLQDLGLVDAPPEDVFDRLAEYARGALGASAAMVSIVQTDRDRQFFKSMAGLRSSNSTLRQTPLSQSFCKFVRASDAPFVIVDAESDPRVSNSPLISEIGVRAYLGCPIHLPDGRSVGALCVIDHQPRSWRRIDIEQLRRIASYVDDAIAMVAAHRRFMHSAENVVALRDECAWHTNLASQIWRGLQRDEFEPHYQPQFDARTGRLVGVEVVMRWNRPERGLVSPSEFMARAADLELLSLIDAAVVKKALRDVERLSLEGRPLEKVSFNVTSAALKDLSILETVGSVSLPETKIALEILESILIDDLEEELDFNLDLLRDRGFSIEVDDFGSGHASIVGLLRVRPDALKIDSRLIVPATENESYRQIIASIIDIARSLGMRVTAEGVETEAHARLLAELGCDVLQGYHLAMPMSFDDLRSYLASH